MFTLPNRFFHLKNEWNYTIMPVKDFSFENLTDKTITLKTISQLSLKKLCKHNKNQTELIRCFCKSKDLFSHFLFCINERLRCFKVQNKRSGIYALRVFLTIFYF